MAPEDLERQLREALSHLYDHEYRPSDGMCELAGCARNDGPLAIQTAVIRAIEDLRPSEDAAPSSPATRIYELLRNRFVLKLTLEETAARMNTSFSSVCRLQRSAVHALARLLWDHHLAAEHWSDPGADALPVEPGGRREGDRATDWRSQAQRELASLRSSAPDAVSDVSEAIRGACDLIAPLMSKLDVEIELKYLQPDLVTTVHRSVVRQLLITAIGRLARYVSPGHLDIYSGREDGNVRIAITGTSGTQGKPDETELIADILAADDVVAEANVDDERLSLTLDLPSVGTVTVLAVDDNPDMARLYRRYSEGTRYHIVHVAHGRDLLETVRVVAPDLILLDVMLPDADGWDLLMRLHTDPKTRTLPVVVCTVVKEEELALSLGAAFYLAKPVRPHEFIQILDQALPRASGALPTGPAHSAAAY